MFSLCVLQEDRAHNTSVFLNVVQRHHETLDPENPRDFIDVYLLRMMEDQKLNPDSSTFSCKNYRSFYRPQTKFAEVMFLHLSVSHSVHGGVVSASVYAGIHTLHSQEQTPPRSRHPPGSRHPLCAVHAWKYGQQAAGTHPTGMHTCFFLVIVD